MPKTVSFQDLRESDLIVDAVYEGEAGGQLSGEPLGTLLPGMGNQGAVFGQQERVTTRDVSLFIQRAKIGIGPTQSI